MALRQNEVCLMGGTWSGYIQRVKRGQAGDGVLGIRVWILIPAATELIGYWAGAVRIRFTCFKMYWQ